MRINTGRRVALGITFLAAVLATAPAVMAGKTKKGGTPKPPPPPGTVTMTAPNPAETLRGAAAVAWTWKRGAIVKAGSKVDIQASSNGTDWLTVLPVMPIRLGTAEWDTSIVPDGFYAVRAVVSGTKILSAARGPVTVDNTAPMIRITRPSRGDVIVDGESRAEYAIVVGKANLEAWTYDAMSGVASIDWVLDGNTIGHGSPFRYDFSVQQPGKHVLTAVAKDVAGNSAGYTVEITTLPGPTATEQHGITLPNPTTVPPLPAPGSSPLPIPAPVTLPGQPPAPPSTGSVPAVPNPVTLPPLPVPLPTL